MNPMPTPTELADLEEVILRHVVPQEDRKRCLIQFVFKELREKPDRKAPITADEVIAKCPGPQDAEQKKDKGWGALRTLKDRVEREARCFLRRKRSEPSVSHDLPGWRELHTPILKK
jgi:hypothetical protein